MDNEVFWAAVSAIAAVVAAIVAWMPYFIDNSIIRRAIRDLNSLDPQERERALEILAQSYKRKAYKALIKALKHPSLDVSNKVTLILAKRRDRRVIPLLINWLGDEPGKTKDARNALEKFGKDSIPYLLETLSSGSEKQKKEVIHILGQIGSGSDKVVSSLIEVLNEANERDVKLRVIDSLGRILDDRAVLHLLEVAWGNANQDIRIAAINALGNPQNINVNVIAELKKFLQDVIECKFKNDAEAEAIGIATVKALKNKDFAKNDVEKFLNECFNKIKYYGVRNEIKPRLRRPSTLRAFTE